MTDRIFGTFAPVYWAAGLPVIPLRERNKMPAISQWSLYGSMMPDADEQADWLASFPKGNIGLPFGSASGLCAIDIDTEDQALIDAIREACGPSPWVRVGKKGMGLVYRWEGQKNFKLRGADGGMICEFLGQGNQMVLPPSIHPDTQLPYTANANLWEILDQIPYLGEDIEDKLRAVLGAKGFELGAGGRSSPLDVIPAGERDVQMIRHAGYLARVVLGIDKSATFGLFDAIMQMHTWVEHFTAKVSGDAMDPSKGVAKLLEFLIKDLEKGRTMPEGWDANLPDEWREHPTIQAISEKNESQRWTVTKAREWLQAKVAEKPDDDEWLVQRIKELVRLTAHDDQFEEFDFEVLVAWMLPVYGRSVGVKKAALVTEFRKTRKRSDDGSENNHAAIARTVLETIETAGVLRYDYDQFWQWNGSCFVRLPETGLYMQVANTVSDNPLVRRNSDYKAIVDVFRNMRADPLVQVVERGINFANGFVGEDLIAREHDPKFGATFTLPFEYHRAKAGSCRRWMNLLEAAWGHEHDFELRVSALQEMFAATLFGTAPVYQKAFLMMGRGGSGKTQILNVLRSLLPADAVASLGPDTWDQQFHLVDLIGKSANICGELPENGRIKGSIFKEVVEGSPVRDSFKGKDGFVFSPTCAHWFASNFLPRSSDSTRGFSRRWLILDFNKPVAKEDQIENLAELIVAEEREAIAGWALEGLVRLKEQRGYTEPPCHTARIGQTRRLNNTVLAFLEDTSQFKVGAGSVKAVEVFDAYLFHQKHVVRSNAMAFEMFLQALEELEFSVQRDLVGDHVITGLFRRS